MAGKIENIAMISAAGSGKTHALTKRFLQLYLHDRGYKLGSLYAITFTNAAAFEMKNRILRYLDVLCTGTAAPDRENEKDVLDHFKSMFPDIQRRAARRRNELLGNFSDLHISTFHSLFASFLSCIPFAAGIMPDHSIIDEPKEKLILAKAVDQILNRALVQEKVLGPLIELIEQRDGAVKKSIDTLYHSLVPWMPHLEALVRREAQIRKAAADRTMKAASCLGEIVEYVAGHAEAAHAKSTGKIDSNFEKLLDKMREFADDPEARRLEPVLKHFLVDGVLGKRYVRSFVARLEEPDRFVRLVERAAEELKRCIEVLSEREMLINFKPVIQLNEAFRAEKQRLSVLSFSDIEDFTRSLRAKLETDYLYFRLGSRMDHLMIDEFQDTSFRQVEILEPIMDEITSVSPEEKSLFYVGDPYQAIFRWREGAPELFDILKAKYHGRIESRKLSVNFRTTREIIEFVNKIFDKDDEVKPGNEGGWIRIEELGAFDSKDEGEDAVIGRTCEIVETLIKDHGYAPDDIAILTRTNEFASDLAKALSTAKIRCASRSRASILDEPDVRFVLHLLRFLDNPQDDFSLFHVLLAAPGGLDEDKIRRLRTGTKTLYLALLDHRPDWTITARLGKLLGQVYFRNPYEIIFQVMQEFSLKISYPLATLLDAALGYSADELNSLSAFVNWFEYHGRSIEVKETHTVGVQIMTVHRAKGLEFEIVLIPETNWDVSQPENAQLLFSYRADTARPDKIYWRRYGKYLANLIEAEQERLKRDALNLLYVALTRAKSGVYVLGCETPRAGIGFWLETMHAKFAGATLPSDALPKRRTAAAGEKTVPYDVMLLEQGPVIKEERSTYSPTERGVEIIEPGRRAGMEFGKLVHRALSWVEWLDGRDIAECAALATEYAESVFSRSADDTRDIEARLVPLITETLSDPDLRPVFYQDGRDVASKNELSIYFEDKKKDVAGQIDRLVIGPDEVVIVDYKTGAESQDYTEQMRTYKRGIERIFPGRSVRTLVVYLEKPRGAKIVET
ncbi:UvrD-helicase domain-containing protein [candidate division WOR-3 bacterium]|nr:UvrD-helicase domain-containing protein [candidate division WOR-3 bacterium]